MRYINQEKVNLKPPESSTSVIRWHQDWAFFPYTNDSLVTVCIAIDDSNKENGKLSDEPFFLNRAEVYTALKISWKCGYSKTELPIKLKYCDQQILFMEENNKKLCVEWFWSMHVSDKKFNCTTDFNLNRMPSSYPRFT